MKNLQSTIEIKNLSKVKKQFSNFFLTTILLFSFFGAFAQSTDKFFGMNYWEYQINASGVSVDKFKENMAETNTWNCSIVRLGGNHANTSRNTDADRDWYVTAIQNIKSMNLIPLVQLPINLTATQTAQWMDYFNVTKGLGITYWGIGNEPDPSTNFENWYLGTYYHDGRNYTGFREQFRIIAKAIKAKDANSIICGPDYRHWWGTSTTGAFGTWYKDFIMGANAVATDTYNGDPILDIFPFHYYGDANEATMASRYAILNPMISAANALRPASQPLKIAIGEYNTDLTISPETFTAGQYMAIMAKQALANSVVYFAPWSIEEGWNFRLLESDGTLRSTAHHMKMLSQNKKANYMSGQINNNYTNNIMEFGMQDGTGYTIMLMNKSATDYSFSVKFSTTSGTYSAANTTLKFRFNVNANIDFSNVILYKNSTLLFTFDAAGNMLKKMEYRSGNTAPSTTNYPVSNTPPTVSITSPITGSSYTSGTSISLAATAADTAPGTVSSVSFYDGATLLGTDTSSPYSFTWAGATVGTHSITAKATDNNGAVTTSGAVSITVNAANTPPTVSITAPVTGSSYTSGTSISLAATAADTAPGTVSSVSFYDGATLLGTDTSSPYSFTWAGATVGSHSITAKATDNNGAVTTSGAVSITVNAANTPPTVSITAPVTGSSYTSGTSITLSATASDTAPGTVSSVSFYDGATLLGTDTSSPYSFTWAGATVGTHSITAKATDNNGAVTTSGVVSITVNAVASNPLTLSYFHLVNSWTKDYMRPTAGGLTAAITQEEVAVVPTLDSYQWEFQAVSGTSYYYIINKYTKKAIQPTGGVITSNTGLSQTTLTATNQGLTELHWSITASNEAGYYWIQNRKSLLYIRPNAGTNGTGVAIVQNTLNTTQSSFKWSLVKLGDKPVTNARVGTIVAETNPSTTVTSEFEMVKSNETIDEIATSTIYPNPADGVIKLRTFIKAEGTVNVTIYDIVGKPVIAKKYDARVGWLQENIDVSELKSGNYILKINQGIVFETKKFIKL